MVTVDRKFELVFVVGFMVVPFIRSAEVIGLSANLGISANGNYSYYYSCFSYLFLDSLSYSFYALN